MDPRNVIVIVIDGLRADHLGLHGYSRATSPWLDRQSGEAVVFDQAYSQSNWTFPSFCSVMASRYPPSHGVLHMHDRLPASTPTLAAVLRDHGFRTAAFMGGTFLDPQFGLDRGFELYRCGKNMSFKDFKDLMPLACDWLRRHRREKFFMVLHDNDLHPPFNIPDSVPEAVWHGFDEERRSPLDAMTPDYYFVRVFNRYPWLDHWGPPPAEDYRSRVEALRDDPAALRHLIAHYDGQILLADRFLEAFWSQLGGMDLLDDTLIVLTSDHGLEWGEHGLITTSFHESLWETVIHVPLLLWRPGRSHRRVSDVVELVDLGPTVLDCLGIDIPREFQGKSLRPLMGAGRTSAAGRGQRCAFGVASTMHPLDRPRTYFVRSGKWKLIADAVEKRLRLYDLERDPLETSDVSALQPEVARDLWRRLSERMMVAFEPVPRQ